MPKPLICIVTHAHLCRNPRVVKEALLLYNAGYRVVILTNCYNKDLQAQDAQLLSGTDIQLVRVTDLTQAGPAAFVARLQHKLGRRAVQSLGWQTPYALGYCPGRYLKACRLVAADLYICHQELPTYIGYKLKQEGFTVAFDLEDWYSEDLLPEARAARPLDLLVKVENFALNHGDFCLTTSAVMAEAMAKRAGANRLPATLYNVFPLRPDLLQRHWEKRGPLRLFWFSQTLGAGRGLEAAIKLLNSVPEPLELHLLGNSTAAYQASLVQLLRSPHQIYFHPLVSPDLLPDFIARFDIGLALEEPDPPSRNLTVTNKFFQYLQAGLPLIASPTAGQLELFAQYQPGLLLDERADMADRLAAWLADERVLKAARHRAVLAAKTLCWEQERGKLLNLVTQTLEGLREGRSIDRESPHPVIVP